MRFDHVGVLVSDLEAAKTFAADVLGLDLVTEFEAPEQGLAGAFYGMGEGKLELFTLQQGREPSGPGTIDHVAVVVDDLEAERDRLADGGVRFTSVWEPEHITEPVEVRGRRHLWTDPATSGGIRVQLTEG